MRRTFILIGLTLLFGNRALAQDQYYVNRWQKDGANNRWYCEYHYKPTPTSKEGVQYIVYDPKDPHWVYWLNPAANVHNAKGQKVYWARCPTKYHPTLGKQVAQGTDYWSILPPEKRTSDFTKLNNADFPNAKEMHPPVPNAPATDKRTIPCPPNLPDDLPKG